MADTARSTRSDESFNACIASYHDADIAHVSRRSLMNGLSGYPGLLNYEYTLFWRRQRRRCRHRRCLRRGLEYLPLGKRGHVNAETPVPADWVTDHGMRPGSLPRVRGLSTDRPVAFGPARAHKG